ncbi:hypothetical protein EDB89DRAFT_2194672 [Lactarius sanguifluus]|nr:hypothetical protein EDB89DRAFT_2194672 [Lactarius sanguifluus]
MLGRVVESVTLCVRELEKLPIPPVEKIKIYQDFNLNPEYLYDSYVALITRPEPLELDEGKKLELLTSLKIARARELRLARVLGPDGAASLFDPAALQLQEPETRSVIRDVFELQGPAPAPPNKIQQAMTTWTRSRNLGGNLGGQQDDFTFSANNGNSQYGSGKTIVDADKAFVLYSVLMATVSQDDVHGLLRAARWDSDINKIDRYAVSGAPQNFSQGATPSYESSLRPRQPMAQGLVATDDSECPPLNEGTH